MREFMETDLNNSGAIDIDGREDLIFDPPAWMRAGLSETASGYGKRLNTGYKIRFEGRTYRLYTTIFGNAGSVWFKTRGRTIHVS